MSESQKKVHKESEISHHKKRSPFHWLKYIDRAASLVIGNLPVSNTNWNVFTRASGRVSTSLSPWRKPIPAKLNYTSLSGSRNERKPKKRAQKKQNKSS
jgi:hypothetical protein